MPEFRPVADADLIIFSSAIRPGNSEYDEALRTGRNMVRRADALAAVNPPTVLASNPDAAGAAIYTAACAGCHDKSVTPTAPCPVDLGMTPIPEGTFMMGSASN